MHLYSNNLSNFAIFSLLIESDLFPACFSCSIKFILSQSSLGSDGVKIVFEIPESEIIKLDDLGNFIGVLSQVDFLLDLLHQYTPL